MKTLYLECGMGAAGDMLTAALLELLPDRQAFVDRLNDLNLPGVRYEMEPVVKCGISGTHMKVTVNGDEETSMDVHSHSHSHDDDHEYHHGHDHDDEHEHHHGHDHDDEHEHHHGHDHDDEHEHHHGHHHGDEHEHSHDGHEHHHGHHHGDEHEHSHDDHEHHHEHHHGDEHEHSHDGHEHHHEHHHHSHTSLAEITEMICRLEIPEIVRKDAVEVYHLIAEAESKVHGMPVDAVHFHEVGTMDAVADVVGVCLLMHEIGADQITASPVHVGSGYVKCMHGVLPVPAPATALILEGIPTYGGAVEGELCTPTGAALLRHFVSSFGDRPKMAVKAIGYGMGKKDFERINCVRAFLGETDDQHVEEIVKLECNLDDMTGEAVGFAMERLFEAGARDVYWQNIGMKKNRPGILLSVVAMPEDADRLTEILFKHTATLGIRRESLSRYVLDRSVKTVETDAGTVRIKQASGFGTSRTKLEYEDIAKLAREKNRSLEEILEEIRRSL